MSLTDYIYIKSKNLKKINNEEIVLIIYNDNGKYEIVTRNMNKFTVKKKSKKGIKKLTKTLSYLEVKEHLWINSKLFKNENTFLMEKIHGFYQKPVLITKKNCYNCCDYCNHYIKCKNEGKDDNNNNEDNDDEMFYKKSSR